MIIDIQSAFNQDNAKNTPREELASSFVVTPDFVRCLCAKHQYIFGTRGSGKTAIARMLSHDHLALLDDPVAQKAIAHPEFVGVYVNTSLGFISSLRQNQNKCDTDIELDFRWRFNVSSCIALTHTIESCLSSYYPDVLNRSIMEARVAVLLSDLWIGPDKLGSLRSLRGSLESLVLKRDQAIARRKYLGSNDPRAHDEIPGFSFDVDLLLPFITAANRFSDEWLPKKSNTGWILSVDEAEFLHPAHRRMLNTLIRSRLPNLFIKIITLPYEYTLETNIPNCHLDINNDIDFVLIDTNYSESEDVSNIDKIGEKIFNARIRRLIPDRNVDLNHILGDSVLLDTKNSHDSWGEKSRMWDMLQKYGSSKTIERAVRLKGTKDFGDQIGRKIGGLLLLIDAIKETAGKSRMDIYSGKSMFLRCSDGNPRRLIRLLKEVVVALAQKTANSANATQSGLPGKLSAREQNDILRRVAQTLMDRVVSEPVLGSEMDKFMRELGLFIHESFVKFKISTDPISGVSINISDDPLGPAVRKLASIGYLFPQIAPNRPTTMPEGLVVWRMAYIFSTLFRTMPRKGRYKNWRSPRRFVESDEAETIDDGDQFKPTQLSLWDNR